MRDNRQKLELAALNNVQRSGLKGLSFRTLAGEIGIKSSSVHYHFPEKSDLARTLIERYSTTFFAELNDISNQKWGLRKKLTAFITIFESVALEDKLCLCGMMAAEVEQLDADNRKLLKSYFIDTEKWLADLFDEHHASISTSLSSKTLSKTLLSGLEGALLLDRVMQDTQRMKAQKELMLSFVI